MTDAEMIGTEVTGTEPTTEPTTTTQTRKLRGWQHFLIFLATFLVVAIIGGLLFLKAYPTIAYNAYHKQINAGLGTGNPIPDNTLYTFPYLASPEAAKGNNMVASGNQDGLYTMGWLAASQATITLPDPAGRYQAVQIINPSNGMVTTLHGPTTTTITGPRLIVARTYAADDSDVPAALQLAQAITLTVGG